MESEQDDKSLEQDREKLFHLVWSMPSEQVAATLGISGPALTKRCTKLGIPKPPRGYWARFKGVIQIALFHRWLRIWTW